MNERDKVLNDNLGHPDDLVEVELHAVPDDVCPYSPDDDEPTTRWSTGPSAGGWIGGGMVNSLEELQEVMRHTERLMKSKGGIR